MKKLLIIVCVIAAVLIVYFLATSDKVKNGLKGLMVPGASIFTSGKSDGMPSATDSGTFTVDKKSSSATLGYSSKVKAEVWDMPIRSGDIVLTNGSITGGTIAMSSANLGKTGLSFGSKEDAVLDIKAIVFDQANSTTDDLVFRTDAELTMNGKKNPVSFKSKFNFQDDSISISGTAMPDWKLWGVTLPSGDSMTINISLHAAK